MDRCQFLDATESMSLGGNIIPVEDLAESLQVAFDSGQNAFSFRWQMCAIPSVPDELFAKFQASFYADPVDAVFKALGVR
jgi:ATP-dependent Lon protease